MSTKQMYLFSSYESIIFKTKTSELKEATCFRHEVKIKKQAIAYIVEFHRLHGRLCSLTCIKQTHEGDNYNCFEVRFSIAVLSTQSHMGDENI